MKAEVAFLSSADLIRNQALVGQPQDRLDVDKLKALGPQRTSGVASKRSKK